LYEAQDNDLCKYVGVQLREKISFSSYYYHVNLSSMSLLPQDCLSIGYFLASIAISYKGRFSVYLSSSSLSDTGIKILMQSLCRSLDPHSECNNPLDMHIGKNKITGVGASYIAEALRTTGALRKLNLEYNPIGDKGLQYIAEALKTNKTLTELSLSICELIITEENGPALTEMLQRNKTLRELNLSWNKAMSDNATSFIIEGLKKNTTLKTLDLVYCGITDQGFCLIQSNTSTCKIQRHYAYMH
jgi:Ran GTPase-activating protein (RanGAP) involved in mRNA processing and transport